MMGIQLNIKSAEARRLAEELAAESGESITQAVTDALRERLKVVRRERGIPDNEMKKREKEFDDIVKGSRALWRNDMTMEDYDNMLYDEHGLPR